MHKIYRIKSFIKIKLSRQFDYMLINDKFMYIIYTFFMLLLTLQILSITNDNISNLSASRFYKRLRPVQ